SDETVAMQYTFEKIPFLYPNRDTPETRILVGIRGEFRISSAIRLTFDLFYDRWLAKEGTDDARKDDQKVDGVIQISLGL
ncbi:MAG: hypothetical protein ACE5HZ_05155, partial [Fidelibacterota bacterium]